MTSERELQIEALADRIRTKLYVYDSLPLDLKTMLRRIGDLDCCPRATIELLPQEKMKYDEAYTDGDTKTIFYQTLCRTNLDQNSHIIVLPLHTNWGTLH